MSCRHVDDPALRSRWSKSAGFPATDGPSRESFFPHITGSQMMHFKTPWLLMVVFAGLKGRTGSRLGRTWRWHLSKVGRSRLIALRRAGQRRSSTSAGRRQMSRDFLRGSIPGPWRNPRGQQRAVCQSGHHLQSIVTSSPTIRCRSREKPTDPCSEHKQQHAVSRAVTWKGAGDRGEGTADPETGHLS